MQNQRNHCFIKEPYMPIFETFGQNTSSPAVPGTKAIFTTQSHSAHIINILHKQETSENSNLHTSACTPAHQQICTYAHKNLHICLIYRLITLQIES